MPLTDATLRGLRCPDGQAELTVADGHGLFAVAAANGKILWRGRFHHNGRQHKRMLGSYPQITLAQARRICREWRAEIEANPETFGGERRTLDDLYEDWYAYWSVDKAERTTCYAVARYNAHVRPVLGRRIATSLRTTDFVDLCLAIERRQRPEVARRTLMVCRQILARATIRGWLPYNVLAGVSDSKIFKPVKERNFARLPIDEMPAFLRALSLYEGSTRVRLATKLLAYTFVRTGELISARWSQFDLDAGLWQFSASKTGVRHIVPLAPQVVELLRKLQQANTLKYGAASTEPERYLFPGDRDSKVHISNNTILKVIEGIGYKGVMTGHGLRGVASTALNEAGFRPDVIETQLAHVQERVRGAYNHAQYLDERREMMTVWADAIDAMESSGVVPDGLRSGARLRAHAHRWRKADAAPTPPPPPEPDGMPSTA